MYHHCWCPCQGCHGDDDDDDNDDVVVAYSGTARYPQRVSAKCPHQVDC